MKNAKIFRACVIFCVCIISCSVQAQITDGAYSYYRVVAVNCDDANLVSISNTVKVKNPISLFIPDAFTPDNDGANDFFAVKGVGITELKVFIYNRWGELVYSADRPDFKWDGSFRGNSSPQGVYTYIIKAAGEEQATKKFTGTLTLLM
jgi:gliding motility-associated-like protein